MPTIPFLSPVVTITPADQFPFYQAGDGLTRRVTAGTLAEFMRQILTPSEKVTQYAAPTTGNTLNVSDIRNSVWLILTPAATLSALTLRMPLVSNTLDKQELLVNSTQIITTLTFDGNGSTLVGEPSSLAANGYFRLRFDMVLQTWYRVG